MFQSRIANQPAANLEREVLRSCFIIHLLNKLTMCTIYDAYDYLYKGGNFVIFPAHVAY